MGFGKIDRNLCCYSINIIILVYVVIISILMINSHNKFVDLVSLLILFAILFNIMSRKTINKLFIYILTALTLYYSTFYSLTIPVYFAYTLLFPQIYSEITKDTSEDIDTRLSFLGKNSIDLIRIYMFLSITALIEPLILFMISIGMSSLMLNILLAYNKIHDVNIKDMIFKKKVFLGEKQYVKIILDKNIKGYLIVKFDDRKYICDLSRSNECIIEHRPKTIGKYNTLLKISIVDNRKLVYRELYPKIIKYTVIPSYKTVIEDVRKRNIIHKDISRIPASIHYKIYIHNEKSRLGILSSGSGVIPLRDMNEFYIEKLLSKLFKILSSKTIVFGEGLRKTVIGEYYGVRHYAPGDRLRDIHWKKSISRSTLFVKEYVSSEYTTEHSIKQRKYLPVIIYDPFSEDMHEYDQGVKLLLKILAKYSIESPDARISVLLIISDHMVLIRGSPSTILAKLIKFFEEEPHTIMYEYESISNYIDTSMLDEIIKQSSYYKILTTIIKPNIDFSDRVVKILLENNILPPRTILFIHGKPTSLKYSILSYILRRTGYITSLIRG